MITQDSSAQYTEQHEDITYCKITKLILQLSKHCTRHKCFVLFLLTLDLNQHNTLALKTDFSHTQYDSVKTEHHLKWSANNMQSNGWPFKPHIFYTIHWQLNSVTIGLINAYLSKCKKYKLPESALPDWLCDGIRTPSNFAYIRGQGMESYIQFTTPPQSERQRHKTLYLKC
jgi:hypothetical protein